MKKFFDISNIKGDLLGGITAGIVALPLALAFGVSSGLGPSAGLYGAIFISFFAALFGGTPTQISGPTAPMTAVSMIVVAGILATYDGDREAAIPAILMVFLLAGLFQIGIGILGLGNYIKYIPYTVVSGFMTAIGVIILITQILPSIGYYPKEDKGYVDQFLPQAEEVILERILHKEAKEGTLVLEDFHETIERAGRIKPRDFNTEAISLAKRGSSGVLGTFKVLPRALQHINWLEVLLSLSTIAIIYGFKKITTTIPSTLVALLAVSGIAIGFNLNYHPIDSIPSGLPIPNKEIFTHFHIDIIAPFIITALTLSLLGAIDSLLTSVVADNMTKTKHNSNRELIGQGIGNSIASIFGGIPGAGATIRTVVNINSGGKTKLSGMFSAILLLIILLALGPIASKIPAAVLSGILITVGFGVMDYKGLKALPKMPRPEAFVLLIVMVLSVVWNLVFAVGIGLIIATLLFMKEMGDITSNKSILKSLFPVHINDDSIQVPRNLKEEVFEYHLNGPLFFGATSQFQQRTKEIPDTATTIIMRLEKMDYLDQSGVYVLEDTFISLINQGKKIILVDIQEQPYYMLERIGIIPDLIPENQTFKTFKDCVDWITINVKDEY
jgi:SulP family sulfate permease